MRQNTLPKAPDLSLSILGFGAWSLGAGSGWQGSTDQGAIETIHAALDAGVTFFDTAPVYGFGQSEILMGLALKGRRHEIVLASKCGLVWDEARNIRRDLSAPAILADVEASLRRLQVEHLDLLQLHWPDPAVPLEALAETLQALRQAGKVRHFGVSNFSAPDTRALDAMLGLATAQGLYNLVERNPAAYHDIPLAYRSEAEILPLCQETGLRFIAYSPLLQGLLAGDLPERFQPGDPRGANPLFAPAALPRLRTFATAYEALVRAAGLTPAAYALAWTAARPGMGSVIAGAQSPAQARANAAAAEVTLPPDLVAAVEALVSQTFRG